MSSVCVCMYVCMSTFSNIFSSDTTGPIDAKCHVKPPWDGGTKVSSNGPGHLTKMAAMPMSGKNLLLRDQIADDIETWYATSSTTKFIQMMTLS